MKTAPRKLLITIGLMVVFSGALLFTGKASPVHADETHKVSRKLSLMTQVTQITPFSNYAAKDWRTAACATGYGAIGDKRQKLYERGIALDFAMTNVFQGVVSGGVDQTWQNTNVTDQQLALDTGRLNWWPAGLFVLHGRSKTGNNVNSEAGTLSPVNIVALTPLSREVDKWFLEEYYFYQALSEEWSVIAGRIIFSGIGDLNRFAGNEKTQFLNTSLRNSPLLGIISQATSISWGRGELHAGSGHRHFAICALQQ